MRTSSSCVFILALGLTVSALHAAGPFFTGLGTLPDGRLARDAFDVSADGTVVVGRTATTQEAFRWTLQDSTTGAGTFQALGFMSGSSETEAFGVSADGSTVVGQGAGSGSHREAFRWTQDTGMVGLGDFPGGNFRSVGFDLSDDGSVVVGHGAVSGGRRAFRWTLSNAATGQGSMAVINSGNSEAHGVSADGSVVVGRSFDSNQAFRWTAGSGAPVHLGTVSGEATSRATSVSADGSVVVGQSGQAFRWTSETGMESLGDLGGAFSESFSQDIAADGSLIVGGGSTTTGTRAFIWDAANGMQNLQDVLTTDFGLGDSLTGWTLEQAYGISGDGKTLVGTGINPDGVTEAWIARMDGQPIQVPRYDSKLSPDSTTTNLVLVTHGWLPSGFGDPDGTREWVEGMADSIRAVVASDSETWVVEPYLWLDEAIAVKPVTALGNAIQLGQIEGAVIGERDYNHVHLIGHSAGAGFVTAATQMIKAVSPDTSVHATYLDAFTPHEFFENWYGTGSDFADQYFTRDLTAFKTQELLLNVFNVDISDLDSGVNSHSFPHEFYRSTIDAASSQPEWGGLGFALSSEIIDPWNSSSLPRTGQFVTLPPPLTPIDVQPKSLSLSMPLSFAGASVLGSSNVQVGEHSAQFQTSSPSWLAVDVDVSQAANFIEFDLTFTSDEGAEGVFAVYWDDVAIGVIDERYVLDGSRRYSFGLEEYAGTGAHQLSFRLDPFSAVASNATVMNVSLGSVTTVPEPTSLPLFVVGTFSLLAFLRIRSCRGLTCTANTRVEVQTHTRKAMQS